MRLFEIDPDTSTVLLNKPWIMMIPEFKELFKRDKGSKSDYRGDKKLRTIKELTFIYFYVDFQSPLRDWADNERWDEALRYAELEDKDVDEKVVQAAEAYKKIMLMAARSLRTYKAMLKSVDALDAHFETLNFKEKDKKGELLHDPLSVAGTIDKMDKVYTALKNFEKRVDEELKAADTGIRGTAETGDLEQKGTREWNEQDIVSGSAKMKSSGSNSFGNMMHELQKYAPTAATLDEEEEEEDGLS